MTDHNTAAALLDRVTTVLTAKRYRWCTAPVHVDVPALAAVVVELIEAEDDELLAQVSAMTLDMLALKRQLAVLVDELEQLAAAKQNPTPN